MAHAPVSPVVLVILDGWGYREDTRANAIAAANTPNVNAFFETYPSTLIHTSGKRVGLPHGQMGNSEVGHLNLGAGRVVPQELVRISDAIEDGSFLRNEKLVRICQKVRDTDKTDRQAFNQTTKIALSKCFVISHVTWSSNSSRYVN